MSLVKATGSIVKSDTVSGSVGKVMILGSSIAGGLWLLAAMIPFVSFPMLLIAMFVVGMLTAE